MSGTRTEVPVQGNCLTGESNIRIMRNSRNVSFTRCFMQVRFIVAVFCLLLLSPGCVNRPTPPTVILISIDGFRWDYLDRYPSPVLNQLAEGGVRARGLIPCFPSKTFPNHYSIVTGLYPENHGIVANNMYDPEFDASFSLGNREEIGKARWWGGEPIWVTAARQGVKSATMFWPGSEADIGGFRPDYWMLYDGNLSDRSRVDQILYWLDLPPRERPQFIAGYFSSVDDGGHVFGPEDPRVAESIQQVDQAIGWLWDGLAARNLTDKVDLILVSDHGMATWVPGQVIVVDDYIDLDRVQVIDWDPVLQIIPDEDYLEKAFSNLQGAHPALHVFRKEQIPERLHFRNHRRIAPLVGLGEAGWRIVSKQFISEQGLPETGGSHGFDNMLQEMQGLFVAHGPSFQGGLMVDPFLNIHLYPLMSKVLAIDPAPNDGDLERVKQMLNPMP